MKFAKELERELVPEWRAKYLDYKLGKKKLKAVSHAVRNVNRTPRTPRFRHGSPSPNDNTATYFGGPRTPENVRGIPGSASVPLELQVDKQRRDHAKSGYSIPARRDYATNPESEPLFREGLDSVRNGVSKLTRYGSILGTPPSGPSDHPSQRPPSLKLPGPALSSRGGLAKENRSEEAGVSAYEAGTTKSPSADKTTFQFWKGNIFGPEMGISRTGTERSRLRRLLSFSGDSPSPGTIDYPMDGYREIESRQSEFFGFLDSELDKIESFYRLKEDEATERLYILRDQLHILRDKRLDEIVKSRPGNGQSGDVPADQRNGANRTSWLAAVDHAFDATFNGRVGKKTQAMATMTTPDRLRARDDHRDYVRRATDAHIPYRSAKRKLKLAIQEFYRALELLKSYALLNRIAFRKLTKKYDKNLNVRPKGRYMSEKVNKAWFVESDVLDGHINAVEDLYARYFEGGNHKLAAGKLKKHIQKKDYHGGALFRIGLFLAAGAVFGVQGLVAGTRTPIDGPSSVIATQTSYLLQLYAGYFFILLLALFFCLACQFWTKSKVNYVFVFEFDTRTCLDWRQLCEIPCFFVFLLGFVIWMNFSLYGVDDMYIYYPVVLIALTSIVLFLPFPILYWRSRIWFLYTNWRLFWSGFYPVEFRDFFIGDLFCSTAYSMGNIEVYFCLYAQHWSNPVMCNSSHSRLFGFFTTLPGIWRALQCVRRYYDTRNAFPHLANCGKYSWTILYYMSLSLYRIDKTYRLRAFFIFCATVNSVYCSIWDLVMDWSLLDPTATKGFLRETLAYKQSWIYYLAIFIDPILRFNWIFYAVYAKDLQHSALLSFLIGLSEVFRRGLWVLIRVENEHCTNVGRFRASRDVPLPFDVTRPPSPSALESQPPVESLSAAPRTPPRTPGTPGTRLTPVATGSERSRPSPSLRRRMVEASPLTRGLNRVGSILHTAHAQDFERRRRPGDDGVGDSSDEDGEEDETPARSRTPHSENEAGDEARRTGEGRS